MKSKLASPTFKLRHLPRKFPKHANLWDVYHLVEMSIAPGDGRGRMDAERDVVRSPLK